MTTVDSHPAPVASAIEFVSLTALRAAHGTLLRRHREAGLTDDLLDDVRRFVRCGRATGAVLETEADRTAAQTLLDYWDTTLYRSGHEADDATLAEFDYERAPELEDELCPYVGLDAFRELSHDKFFGRQRLIDEWIDRLRGQRLLVVLGLSGSGKSSLVMGGLIPALKAGALPGTQDWWYFPALVPGSDPLTNLARAVRPVGIQSSDWVRPTVEGFRNDPGHLAKLLDERGPTTSVVFVDQFEELFTLCADEDVRQAFVDNLLSMATAPDQRHLVILTMRSDYEPHLTLLSEFQSHLEQAQVRVGPLHPTEMREAIERPAQRVGLQFEEGVVDDLVHEMRSEPAGLPLLQFTLLKLWERRTRNRVTRDAYARLGGVRRALEISADQFYAELTPHDQGIVKRMLLRMVRPDSGLEVTSKRVLRTSLYSDEVNQLWVDSVLDKLIDARLVRETGGDAPADSQIEVAHEALVRNWSRLLEWLDEEREALRGRSRLATAAEHWDASGRPPDGLLRGQVLDEARAYQGLTALESQFLACSEANEARELCQRRRASRLRLVAVTTIILLTVALPVTLAVFRYLQVQERADLLLARQLVAQARALLKDGQPDLALLLSVEAFRAHDGVEARGSLLTALAYTPESAISTIARDHATAVKGVAFSPDGDTLASVDDEGRIVLWSSTTYQPLSPPLKSISADGMTVVAAGLMFTQDGSTLAMIADDGRLVLWCVATHTQLPNPAGSCRPTAATDSSSTQVASTFVWRDGDEINLREVITQPGRPLGAQLTGLTPGTSIFALSPDGNVLAGGSEDGQLYLWNTVDGQPYANNVSAAPGSGIPSANQPVRLPAQASGVQSLAFNRDGSKLAWGTADGTVGVWQIARGRQIHTLHDSKAAVTSLAFGPEDKLAWGSDDTRLYARDLSTSTRLPIARVISPGRASSAAVAFSPDGQDTAFVNPDTGVTLISTDGKRAPRDLSGGEPITILAFGVRDGFLTTGSQDGSIRRWDIGSDQPDGIVLGTLEAAVTSIALSPTSNLLAAGGGDGQIVLLDTATGGLGASPVKDHAGAVSHVVFSADGSRLASVGEDGVRVWNVSGHELRSMPFHDPDAATRVQSVDFSRDGKFLAWGAYDGTIVIWNILTGERHAQLRPSSATPIWSPGVVSPFTRSKASVTVVAFHPNGDLIASGAFGGGVTLWDIDSGQALAPPLMAHAEPVTSLSFSRNGTSMASASADAPLVAWTLDVRSWIRYACDAARRNLTDTEPKQYLGDKPYTPTCPEVTPTHENPQTDHDLA
jgi:WD40 repeat protein